MDICTFCNEFKEGWTCDMDNGLYGFICIECVGEERTKPYIEKN